MATQRQSAEAAVLALTACRVATGLARPGQAWNKLPVLPWCTSKYRHLHVLNLLAVGLLWDAAGAGLLAAVSLLTESQLVKNQAGEESVLICQAGV